MTNKRNESPQTLVEDINSIKTINPNDNQTSNSRDSMSQSSSKSSELEINFLRDKERRNKDLLFNILIVLTVFLVIMGVIVNFWFEDIAAILTGNK